MTVDNPGAVLSTVLHASISWAFSLFCVVTEQPAWLPILCAVIAAVPSAVRLVKDRRLQDEQKINAALRNENARLLKLLDDTP